MLGQGLFSWFGTSNAQSSEENVQPTWDPKTLTMAQPFSPAAPTTDKVVTNQPTPTEDMQLQLRGGVAAAAAASAVAIVVVLMGPRVDQKALAEVQEVLLVEAPVVGKAKGCLQSTCNKFDATSYLLDCRALVFT
ncbi:hypothetical protein BDV32DRAFT_152398 [Aspergillus pseudonomiae]|uniref:Uncharacterized protein n=1 Tax=Aspergillus pseudonomiae TaxID=1506151 RepID=A0A5N7CW47_9EURO|nr:uncharacterized protein BDV37DRAFT_289120 [Aspergillus pseudonomiae]KAB8257389.1 hypothetical protein BDV32DRAFT_152398 [Aspergillus pseudonomiae]KAE8397803.1 hypothetical protein BDV37DRAFT_289120 [Aspergillus pseudonomiae]